MFIALSGKSIGYDGQSNKIEFGSQNELEKWMEQPLTTIDPALAAEYDLLESLTVQLGWVARRRLEKELDAYGLTPPQYMVLRCIRDSERGCSMSELAESSFQVSATMTGIVDRLVERGLVQRERDPHDRRTLRVVLTGAGTDLLAKVSEAKRQWLHEFFGVLSPEDRKRMIEMGRRYLEIVQSAITP